MTAKLNTVGLVTLSDFNLFTINFQPKEILLYVLQLFVLIENLNEV